MKIAVFSNENIDVSKAIDELITKYSEQSPEVLFPVKANQELFTQSVIRKCLENKVKTTLYCVSAVGLEQAIMQVDGSVTCEEPLQEVLRQLSPGDAVGIVWTDSMTDHLILHTVEDLALDTWDITDGIDPIEMEDPYGDMDAEQLHEAMHKTVAVLVELMSAYVASTVMDSISQAVMERIRNDIFARDSKLEFPFDDDGE
jgi:hypothetical protein